MFFVFLVRLINKDHYKQLEREGLARLILTCIRDNTTANALLITNAMLSYKKGYGHSSALHPS